MKSWPVVALGEICQINPRISKDQMLNAETRVSFIPMASVNEIDGVIATPEERPYSQVSKGYTPFKNGDVLFARITPCMENGKAAIAENLVNGLGFGSTEFHILRPSENILSEYVHFFLRRPDFRRFAKASFTGTAGQQRVPTSFMKSVQIRVPPPPQQRYIVDILNRANGILRLRRQAQEKARQLIPALFVKMFGDLASNSHKCEITRFCDLLVRPLRNGISPSRRGRHQAHVLTLSAITRGYFDATAIKVGLFEEPLRLGDQVSSEDFLICRGNGNLGLVGRGQFPNCSMQDVAFPDTIIASRPDTMRLMPEYLQAVWNSDFLRRQIETAAKTTNGTFKINQSATENFRLPLPPIGLQRTFATHVGNIHSIIAQQNRMAAASERLVGSLMHRMFDGA